MRNACDSNEMLRGKSLKSRLARLAVAYAIALQGLLAAWGGVASAHSIERDAALSLCRTLAADDGQPSDESKPIHCVVMCLSGACSGGSSPPPTSAAIEYSPRQVVVFHADHRETTRTIAPLSSFSARGPPTIV
jgi:hypothetical protein